MAVAYTAPIYFSDCFGREMEVETVVDIIISTPKADLRNNLLLELHQHLLDYECSTLKRVLANLDARFGHKRYEKPPTSTNMPQPGTKLEYGIFYENYYDQIRQENYKIDMLLLHQWIRNNFLPLWKKKYSWFALWRFLNDKSMLKDTKISNFCTQMSDWFYTPDSLDEKKPMEDNVWLYNGYLSEKSYQEWNEAEFLNNKRQNQTLDGFTHLRDLCFKLAGKWIPSRLKPHIQTQS